MRWLPILVAVALPLRASAAQLSPDDGLIVTICTADGSRVVALGRDGKPVAPSRRDPFACAHLWCDGRRSRRG